MSVNPLFPDGLYFSFPVEDWSVSGLPSNATIQGVPFAPRSERVFQVYEVCSSYPLASSPLQLVPRPRANSAYQDCLTTPTQRAHPEKSQGRVPEIVVIASAETSGTRRCTTSEFLAVHAMAFPFSRAFFTV
jgi:hypothetical protein